MYGSLLILHITYTHAQKKKWLIILEDIEQIATPQAPKIEMTEVVVAGRA